MATSRRVVVVGLLVGLGGCGEAAFAPDLTAEMPTRYAASDGRAVVELGSDWVKGFGSRELAELVALGDADNLDIEAATQRIAQAEAELAASQASLAPSLDGTTSASRTITPGTRSSFSPPFKTSVVDSYSLGVSGSWTIDLNGRLRALAAAAGAAAEAARIERDAVRLTTATAIADAWLRVGAAREQIRIARESVATAERTLTVYRRRLEVGTATALDLAQQESLVASQRASVPALEITARQTRNALVVLTGRVPEAFDPKIARVSGVRVPSVAAGLPSRLLTRRPDVAVAEANLAAQAANVEAARAAFLPEITLTGSTGLASAFLKNLLRPDAVASQAAAGLTAPIFDAGARSAALDQARARHAELVATYRSATHQALADVENALVAVDQYGRQERLQRAVVTAARKAQRLTEERLTEGTIDVTTVLEAERTLFSAEQTLVTVRLARARAVVSLIGALGGGWSKPAPTALAEGAAR
ncbi:MAG: efflux transporter outer membrane subunit [Hyphomicrobiales bacterium]|nr:efflux transporter outer membrane subunit [Hyphomicrobiales bacterium]